MTDRLIDYINGGKQLPQPPDDELMKKYKDNYFYGAGLPRLSQESPTFASSNSAINDDPATKEPKKKFDKGKDALPTTGEKGEVALQNEKSHRDTIKSVFGYSHDARIPSRNTGQMK